MLDLCKHIVCILSEQSFGALLMTLHGRFVSVYVMTDRPMPTKRIAKPNHRARHVTDEGSTKPLAEAINRQSFVTA